MLKEQLQQLRMKGLFAQARDLIRSQPEFNKSGALQSLAYEHEDFWWTPITGKRVTLHRRGPAAAAFVRECWADADFMGKFNRMARPLPSDDAALRQILAREHAGILSEARALHWTIYQRGAAVGFVSATGCSQQHRRCEFLVGVLRQRPSVAPMEAAALAIDFLNARALIERFTAYFYPENTHAATVARKFGFEPEGRLRAYLRTADGQSSDLLVAGLVVSEISRAKKLRSRIISRKYE